MPRPERRDLAKERRWRRLLQQWRRSGLTGRDFCSQNSLSEPNFYAWKREIAKRDEEQAAPQATARLSAEARFRAEALPAFLPVTLDAAAASAAAASAVAASAVEVVLASGRVLRVQGGFDADVLRRLLAVLEAPSC